MKANEDKIHKCETKMSAWKEMERNNFGKINGLEQKLISWENKIMEKINGQAKLDQQLNTE